MLSPKAIKERQNLIALKQELIEKEKALDEMENKAIAGFIALSLLAAVASHKPRRKKRWYEYL